MLRWLLLLYFVAIVSAYDFPSRHIRRELQAKHIVNELRIPGFNVEENYFASGKNKEGYEARLFFLLFEYQSNDMGAGLKRCQPLMDERCSRHDPSEKATMCDNRSEADSFRTNPDRVPIGDSDGVRRLIQLFYCGIEENTEEPSFKIKDPVAHPKTTLEKYERGIEDNSFDGSVLEILDGRTFHKHCSETERPQVICLQQNVIEKPLWNSCNCWFRDGFESL